MELLEFEFLEISPEGRGLAVWGIFPVLCRQSLGQCQGVARRLTSSHSR